MGGIVVLGVGGRRTPDIATLGGGRGGVAVITGTGRRTASFVSLKKKKK